MMKTIAMNVFTHGLLPNCTTPNGPAMALTMTPRAVNRTIMPRQKMMACVMPSRLVPDCRLMKYETVKGIIGNTHGVKMAARPAPKVASRNSVKSVEGCGCAVGGADFEAGAAACAATGLTNSV